VVYATGGRRDQVYFNFNWNNMLLSAFIPGWFLIIGTASILMILIFFFLLFIQFSKKRFEHMKEVFTLQEGFQRTLLQTQLEIQESTFTQISEEIHDNIGQMLSLVRINLNRLSSDSSQQRIDETDELLGKAIVDLRNLSHTLNSNFMAESGLTSSLTKLVETIRRSGSLQVHFTAPNNTLRISREKSIILFRMIQESINNVMKHAGATELWLTLEEEANIMITIIDNGKGFDTKILETPSDGLGLNNIFTRAKMIGGEVDIKSAPDSGTSIMIKIKPDQ
jgi:signal transduction histidine kinase